MSLRLEKGGVYTCCRFRSGASERGRWEIVAVIEDARYAKTKQEITIFPSEIPSGMQENMQFRIKDILSVTRRKKKGPDGNWNFVDVCMEAEIEPVKDELNLDGDLPFTFGAYDNDEEDDTVSDLFAPSKGDLL